VVFFRMLGCVVFQDLVLNSSFSGFLDLRVFQVIGSWFFGYWFVSFADTKMLRKGGDWKLIRLKGALARRRKELPDERPERG
jgi:hypothetical protein